jgi:hypothetical protein
MSTNRTDLPSPNASNFGMRMRETLMTYLGRQGDPLDRGLTLRDLIENGIIKLRDGFVLRPGAGSISLDPGANVGAEEPDLTPPPQPTGFTVAAGISYLFVEHNKPTYTTGHGHLRTRLYGATWTSGPLPTFTNAVEIAQFTGQVYSHTTNPATTWHLWIKWESVDGVLSPTPAGGTNGLAVTTGQNVTSLLAALNGQLTASELNTSLSSRIDLIDAAANVTGSVANRVAAEASARAQAILDEASARSSGDASLQTQINTLSAASTGDLSTLLAALQEEQTARINADTAEATQRTTLATQMRGSYTGTDITQVTTGLVYEERQARSSADSALSTQINVVSAVASSKNQTYLQPTAPTGTLVAGDVWYDSDDNNKSYRYSGSTWVATDDVRITANAAAITSEQTARAAADSAMASDISTLTSTVNGNTAAIQTEATTRATQTGELYAKYTVKLDVNGYVSGFGLASTANNATPYSQFIFKADQFAFGAPGHSSIYPFVIQASATTVNGVSVPAGVYMDAAYIKNGTITNVKIANAAIDDAKIANLSASKITTGTLDAARIAASSITADKIDSRNLTIRDAAGNIILGSGTALNWANLVGQPSSIYNANITLSSNGTLSGGGGGQVTIGGLGYVGDLNATYGADFNSNLQNRPSDDQLLNNLLDTTAWVPGQSPPWATNGDPSQSAIVFGNGPKGFQVPLWECRSQGSNSANGGWNPDASCSFTVDTAKTYRFAVPVKRTAGTSGSAYWGIAANTVCDLNTTSVNGNPYFAVIGGGSLVIDRWYLMVGYVYPEGSTGLTHAGAGIYDMTTGQLVSSGTNYCWRTGTTSSGTRAYLYYSTSASDRQQFSSPVVHAVNGTESSMTELLATSAILNSGIALSSNGQLLGGGGGQVTLPGLGAGAMATLNQITQANASTYIASGAIGDALIGNVIQSAGYVQGTSGWKLDKTGQMELNSAVYRGTIDVKSASTGQRLEIKNNVIKVYDSSNRLRVRMGDLTA